MRVIFFLAIVALAGCSSAVWMHSSKNESDFERDRWECNRDTSSRSTQGAFAVLDSILAFRQCLSAKGWRL